jgi:hypothetical protein
VNERSGSGPATVMTEGGAASGDGNGSATAQPRQSQTPPAAEQKKGGWRRVNPGEVP